MAKKRRSKALDALVFGVVRSILFVIATLPEFVVYPGLDHLGRLYLRLSKKRRAIALHNLRLALGATHADEELTSLARRACGASFMVLGDVARVRRMLASGRHASRVEDAAMMQQLQEGLSAGGPVRAPIFCTPHIGSWEIAAMQLGLHYDHPVVIARPLGNPFLQSWLVRSRSQLGVAIVPRRGGVRTLVAALRQNRAIGLLPDQNQRTRGLFVEVFGKLASCDRSPARLAQMTGAPIATVACYRVGRRYRFRMELDSVLRMDPGDDDLEGATRCLQASIEALVLRAPEQYFWIHDRYRTRPTGAYTDA